MILFTASSVTLALICTIFFLIYQYFQRSFQFWSKRNVPHPKPSFPFGNFKSNMTSAVGTTIQQIYIDMKSTGAKYCGYHMLAMPFFMPLTPDLYKEIFIKNFNLFYDRGFYYDEENDPLTANLATLPGAKWRSMRSKLSPAFTPIKLKMMFPLMKQCSSSIPVIVEKLNKIEIHDLATRYTMDVISSCAFGINGNCLTDPNAKFVIYGRKLLEFGFIDSIRMACAIMAPEIMRTFKINIFNPKYTKFFNDIVHETVEYREKNKVKRNDLMDLLIRLKNNETIEDYATNGTNKINDEEPLTINQIAAQVFIFLMAGYETTSVALTFCMYELARNPDIQQKIREEILCALKISNGEINFEVVNNDMPYADKVLQETMRMYPSIVLLNRICTKRYQLADSDLVLEEGTRVVISTLGVHYDPEFYPNPHCFDPERFTQEEKAKRPQMTYFPFGEGPRICIGQKFAMLELKLALIEFLKDYKYILHPSTSQNIKIVSNVHLLEAKEPVWLQPIKM